MVNLAVSLLNVKDINDYLLKLKEAERKMNGLFNVTIHFDVMDNEFVPNTGIEIEKIAIVKDAGYYTDAHLMVARPIEDGYIDKAIEYGCRDITIHYEIENFEKALNYLLFKKEKLNGNLKIGVSIKPGTEISVLDEYMKDIDKILVMSVEPGFGGQSYIISSTDKITGLKSKYDAFVQVDGGIKDSTIEEPVKAGVDSVVVGSFLTKDDSKILENIKLLENVIKNITK